MKVICIKKPIFEGTACDRLNRNYFKLFRIFNVDKVKLYNKEPFLYWEYVVYEKTWKDGYGFDCANFDKYFKVIKE